MKFRVLILAAAFMAFLPVPLRAKSLAYTNALNTMTSLSGTYIALRHGESVPSLEHRVCGSMEAGTDKKNGLTPKGREEVVQSTTEWIKVNKKMITEYLKQDKLVVVTSPFSRTKETAEAFVDTIQEKLKSSLPKKYRIGGLRNIIVVENDLRERYFGQFEGQGNSGKIYDQVWAEDRKNPNNINWGVESPNAVQERASRVIAHLEKQSQAAGGKLFVLVSHGDTLKISQTAFQKQSASEHCNKDSVAPFKTAEFRPFKLTSGKVASTLATKKK